MKITTETHRYDAKTAEHLGPHRSDVSVKIFRINASVPVTDSILRVEIDLKHRMALEFTGTAPGELTLCPDELTLCFSRSVTDETKSLAYEYTTIHLIAEQEFEKTLLNGELFQMSENSETHAFMLYPYNLDDLDESIMIGNLEVGDFQ